MADGVFFYEPEQFAILFTLGRGYYSQQMYGSTLIGQPSTKFFPEIKSAIKHARFERLLFLSMEAEGRA